MITYTSQVYKNHEILLFDPHGEYTGCLAMLPNYAEDYKERGVDFSETWVRCQVIWDGYQMTETISHLRVMGVEGIQGDDEAERRVTDAFHLMFDDKLDKLIDFATPDSATIWKLSGGIEGLTRAFNALFTALNIQPSGDDDVFDYWPNTMDMLYAFATDLDELEDQLGRDSIGGLGGYRERVAEMASQTYHERYDQDPAEYDYLDEWGHEARWPNPLTSTPQGQ